MDAQETIKKKWGGKRRNAGRKPSPGTLVRKKNAEEKEIAKTVESYFKTGKTLKCPDDLDDDARIEWNRLMGEHFNLSASRIASRWIRFLSSFSFRPVFFRYSSASQA